MKIILILLALPLFTFVCWVWFLAVMQLAAKRDQLHSVVLALATLVLWIGLVLDFILTVVVGTLIFLSWPREWKFTDRLKRHLMRESADWRYREARWICDRLLNPFDPKGRHC